MPHGETACDIWTIDRMPVEYLDSPPTYLLGALSSNWKTKRVDIKNLCRQAIERRSTMRTYIQWLRGQIREL